MVPINKAKLLLLPLLSCLCWAVQAQQSVEEDIRSRAEARTRDVLGRDGSARLELPRVTSESRAFVVIGEDSLRAGAIASRADDIRKHLQEIITLPALREFPIHLELRGKSTDSSNLNPYELSIDILEKKPIIKLDVHIGGGIDINELHRYIVRACLYEHALRSVDLDAYEEGEAIQLRLPLWLTLGIEQTILWRGGRVDRSVFVELFQQSDILHIEELLDMPNDGQLDGRSRQIMEASSAALVQSLIAQEQGKQLLLSLLEESLNSQQTSKEMIQSYFHELGMSDNALQKWWALELAKLASPKLTETQAPLASEESLATALIVTYFDEESRQVRQVSFDDIYNFVKIPNYKKLIPNLQNRLIRIGVYAFPGYRPIITEYRRAAAFLEAGNEVDEIFSIIGPLRELREAYITTAKRGRDYLDWYEITQLAPQDSPQLQQYLRLRQQLREEHQPVETHMSRYLRDIEKLMHLPSGKNVNTAL